MSGVCKPKYTISYAIVPNVQISHIHNKLCKNRSDNKNRISIGENLIHFLDDKRMVK